MASDVTAPAGEQVSERLPAFRIGGVRVHAATMAGAVAEILRWAQEGECHFVCVRDAHGVVRAQKNAALHAAHDAAGLVVTDGMPLLWRARALGFAHAERIVGRDLMLALCDKGRAAGLKHYFYGGAPGVAEELAAEMQRRFPGLEVAGCHCPPFRALTAEEDAAVCAGINDSGAHVVWVGLSTPKQEAWMAEHTDKLNAAALMGVGAAFDYHTGRARPAPDWMQRAGLEWVFRILQDPGRLLSRYLVVVPQFLWIVMKDTLRGSHKR